MVVCVLLIYTKCVSVFWVSFHATREEVFLNLIYTYMGVSVYWSLYVLFIFVFLLCRLEDHREVNQIFLDLLPDMEKISTFQERLVSKMPTTQPLENL